MAEPNELLVPIRALRWYRFERYGGTDSSAMVVPIRRYYQFTFDSGIRYKIGRRKLNKSFGVLCFTRFQLDYLVVWVELAIFVNER